MGKDQSQIEGLLGDLERAIMEVVWRQGEVNVRDVQSALASRHPAYTTVMTVMSRLADKGVLVREKRGRAFVYRGAEQTRIGFVRKEARDRVRALLNQFGDLAIAEFVDELSDTDAESLAAIESLLDEARRDAGESEADGDER